MGENIWDVLNDYLTINSGSGCFILSGASGALDKFQTDTIGVTSIALSSDTITAEFTEDFVDGKDNAITLYLNEYVLDSDDIPIMVIFDRYYTVGVNITGSGSVTLAKGYTSDQMVSGGSVNLTITPANGWSIKSVTLNGANVKSQVNANGKLTVNNVMTDITLNENTTFAVETENLLKTVMVVRGAG